MKKVILTSFIIAASLITVNVKAQSSLVKFTPSAPDTTVAFSQNNLTISYLKGSLGTYPAMYFIFKNTGTSDQSFSWVLKDRSGNTAFGSQKITIPAGQTIDYDNPGNNMPSASAIINFMYFLNGNAQASDYTMNINQ